jgi:hypothetical protein
MAAQDLALALSEPASLARRDGRRECMTESPMREIIVRSQASAQADLSLAADGVLRYVWEGRFGAMLIEVREGRAYVNGELVESPVEAGRS